MTSQRQRLLYTEIKKGFITIQKSKQITKEMSHSEREAVSMNEKEIDNAAKIISSRCEECLRELENNEKRKPTAKEVQEILKRELNHYRK